MNPLDALMRPVARLINRNIADSITAAELAEQLDGQRIDIRVNDTPLAITFAFQSGAVEMLTADDGGADARISGSLSGLARLASGGDIDLVRRGDVSVDGDIGTVQSFQKLLKHAKPDPEEELSRLVGDAAAHQLGEFARGVREWGEQSRETMADNVKEYLQEETGDVPSRDEVERFGSAVGKLRDDVDRFEARVERLEERRR